MIAFLKKTLFKICLGDRNVPTYILYIYIYIEKRMNLGYKPLDVCNNVQICSNSKLADVQPIGRVCSYAHCPSILQGHQSLQPRSSNSLLNRIKHIARRRPGETALSAKHQHSDCCLPAIRFRPARHVLTQCQGENLIPPKFTTRERGSAHYYAFKTKLSCLSDFAGRREAWLTRSIKSASQQNTGANGMKTFFE